MKKINLIFGTALALLYLNACLNSSDNLIDDEGNLSIETMVVPDDFNYSTVKDVNVILKVPEFLSNSVFSLYTYKSPEDSACFAKGTFDENGEFSATYTIPAYIDTLLVQSNYVGLIQQTFVSIEGSYAEFDYSPYYEEEESYSTLSESFDLKSASASGFTYMGSFNSSGVPYYLTTSDAIEQNLLDDINSSLPEGSKLTDSHPEYLADSETNIILTKEAEVWITFVAEGAGWTNALGYYTYKVGEEPSTADKIETLNIIFPNASASGSGGGLVSGNKVYLGTFPANTVIAWFLVANGWTGSGVSTGNGIRYSQPDFNTESDASLRQHMVLLYDKARELLILGFEDMDRQSGSDDDFNDAIFYATANPIDAVQTESLELVDAANDSDGDGINDELDDFPYDPDIAFNNFSPSEGSTGSLAFEDLWPSKGDYDFNDLVIEYSFNQISNSKNRISKIEANFTIKHIGGSNQNGFAFTIPVNSSKISSIENQVFNSGYVNVNANGVESNSSNSTIFVAENTHSLNGEKINLIINFAKPVSTSELGTVPFNPFIVIDGERDREVHLADLDPTSLGLKYLGTKDDYSDVNIGRYFKTNRNLPWGLNVYGDFEISPEKVSIDVTYPRFVTWANSGGTVDLDWYK